MFHDDKKNNALEDLGFLHSHFTKRKKLVRDIFTGFVSKIFALYLSSVLHHVQASAFLRYNLFDLQGIQIYKKLSWLNELPSEEAEYVLGECSGSPEWAHLVMSSRPFPLLNQLFVQAEQIWLSLEPENVDGWTPVKLRLERLLER